MPQAVQYQFSPVPFTSVTIDDAFWKPRIETNRTVTIPYDFQMCEETGRISNFAKAAGRMEGDHEGIFFNDSDVFKVVEGAAYSLTVHPDPELEAYVDGVIDQIAAAQEEDGYLYTARTIAERNDTPERLQADREGLTRWSNLRIGHELYNVGHMYEAAVAYYQATGKRTLLDVSIKNADLIDSIFGPDKKRDVPGHQEIEIGLTKLSQVTGDDKYIKLAKFFLDERGHANDRELQASEGNVGYMQDHQPVIEQSEAVGHSVRAVYMYSGMADVAVQTGDADYIAAIDRIWDNVVSKKLYLTGGIGARHQGEAFGENYELPNETAYTETCAAIANAMWNHRMFLLHGESKYMDIVERVIYNGFLSGISLSGDRFFYSNPLAFDGEFLFNRDDSSVRNPWFSCSCCPTNVVRFIPSLSGYVYAYSGTDLYVNLFIGGCTQIRLENGMVQLSQETNYPWEGQIKISIETEQPIEFTLRLRIPGWSTNQSVPSDLYTYLVNNQETAALAVNGESVAIEIEKGYACIQRRWQAGDVVELTLPMPIRRVLCHENVEPNVGRVALERGPIVYCLEAVDNETDVYNLALSDESTLKAERQPDLLNGVTVLRGTGHALNGSANGAQEREFTAIPYYAWAHRGTGKMVVWLPRHGV